MGVSVSLEVLIIMHISPSPNRACTALGQPAVELCCPQQVFIPQQFNHLPTEYLATKCIIYNPKEFKRPWNIVLPFSHHSQLKVQRNLGSKSWQVVVFWAARTNFLQLLTAERWPEAKCRELQQVLQWSCNNHRTIAVCSIAYIGGYARKRRCSVAFTIWTSWINSYTFFNWVVKSSKLLQSSIVSKFGPNLLS